MNVLFITFYHVVMKSRIRHAELPRQKRIIKDVNIATLLSKAAGILKCDMDLCRESIRISKSVKADRDLLIFIVWQNQRPPAELGV